MKASQVFAAHRQAVIAELHAIVGTDLLPQFTAEVEDINLEYERNAPAGDALARHTRHARTMDLVYRRQQFIDKLNKAMQEQLAEMAGKLGGKIETVKEAPRSGGAVRDVVKALFSDGSKASVPQTLWIDFKQFPRVATK